MNTKKKIFKLNGSPTIKIMNPFCILDFAMKKMNLQKLIKSASKSDLKSKVNSKQMKIKLHHVLSSGQLDKEKQEEVLHNSMLEEELIKFRKEIEAKFHDSICNRTYVFPRLNPINPESLMIKIDCTFSYILVTLLPANTNERVSILEQNKLPNNFSTFFSFKGRMKQQLKNNNNSSKNGHSKTFAKIQTLVYNNIKSLIKEKNKLSPDNADSHNQLILNTNHFINFSPKAVNFISKVSDVNVQPNRRTQFKVYLSPTNKINDKTHDKAKIMLNSDFESKQIKINTKKNPEYFFFKKSPILSINKHKLKMISNDTKSNIGRSVSINKKLETAV